MIDECKKYFNEWLYNECNHPNKFEATNRMEEAWCSAWKILSEENKKLKKANHIMTEALEDINIETEILAGRWAILHSEMALHKSREAMK